MVFSIVFPYQSKSFFGAEESQSDSPIHQGLVLIPFCSCFAWNHAAFIGKSSRNMTKKMRIIVKYNHKNTVCLYVFFRHLLHSRNMVWVFWSSNYWSLQPWTFCAMAQKIEEGHFSQKQNEL